MKKSLWNSLLASPAVFGAMLVVGAAAVATETPREIIEPSVVEEGVVTPFNLSTEVKVANNTEIDSDNLSNTETYGTLETSSQDDLMGQVTSVSQFADVQPTDWAFQALQALVERYGCIAGYPDGTYRGNRALTRYEFAAGVYSCLERINELIATATADLVTKEDLVILQRLQEEFAAELATLRGRTDALEARTAELEANQFSTTTKLSGQVVAAVTDVLAGDEVNGEEIEGENIAFGARARIEFVTSFFGEDILFTRLQANNILGPDLGTPEGSLFFAGEDGTTDVAVDALFYSFPISEQASAIVIANAGAADDLTETVNIFDGDGAFGALSTFGTRNPIYYLMDGAGLGINYQFSDALALSLGYLASEANLPSQDSGVFNGPYGALAQLTITPSDRLTIGLTYIHAYNQELGAGSNLANPRSLLQGFAEEDVVGAPGFTGTVGDLLGGFGFDTGIPTVSNAYGVELSWQLSNNFVLGGWVGYTNTRTLSTGGGLLDRGEIESWNWAVTLGFPDLGKEGNLAGIIFGMEPKVVNSTVTPNPALAGLAAFLPERFLNFNEDDDTTSYHIEAFYQYRVTENIYITPGVIWLTAPDHNSDNEDVVIGAIRTTFTF